MKDRVPTPEELIQRATKAGQEIGSQCVGPISLAFMGGHMLRHLVTLGPHINKCLHPDDTRDKLFVGLSEENRARVTEPVEEIMKEATIYSACLYWKKHGQSMKADPDCSIAKEELDAVTRRFERSFRA